MYVSGIRGIKNVISFLLNDNIIILQLEEFFPYPGKLFFEPYQTNYLFIIEAN